MMNKYFLKIYFLCVAFCFSLPLYADMPDDPLLGKIMVDRFELQNNHGDSSQAFEAEGWLGKDLNKLWFKSEIERTGGKTEHAELQFLYSKAVAPYWDMQLGVRKDFQPSPSRSWAVIGIKGLAPYYFDVDAALFVGEAGRTAFRLQVEYELLFTQQLILSPELEVNFYGQNDRTLDLGSGLSDMTASLRLRYEVNRKIAPYIGVSWVKKYGNTAEFSKLRGNDVTDSQWIIGLRFWF